MTQCTHKSLSFSRVKRQQIVAGFHGGRGRLVRLVRNEQIGVHRPDKPRNVDDIDPNLRETLRGLWNAQLPWPLFLYSNAGVGKSSAALCPLDYADGWYVTVDKLAHTTRRAKLGELFNETPTATKIDIECFWRSGATIPQVVVLDEMGKHVGDKVGSHVYDTVCEALERREYKPLTAISNLSLEGIERAYDDRVASRAARGVSNCAARIDG